MTTLTLSTQLSKEVFNTSQKFTKHLNKYQQGNFREIVRGMIVSGSVHLAKISRTNGRTNNLRKDVERLSNTLDKIPSAEFTQIHINKQISKYKEEPVLILSDGGDFQKPYAKKMEKVCGNVDGSNGHKKGWGFPIESLVAYGTKTETLTPLACHLFSTQLEDYKSDWKEHKKVFDMITPLIESSAHDRIIVEDRACDDQKRYKYFLETLKCSFVTRIGTGKKSRNVIIKDKDNNEITVSIQSLAKNLKNQATNSRTWFNKKLNKELESKIAYQKVFLPNNKDIPLYAIFAYSQNYDEPLVVLTDLITENPEQAWKHFFYYKKRWEVENFYRAIKQNFNAEEFLVLGFKKIQALAFMLMFVMSLVIDIKNKAKEFLGILYNLFKDFCKKEQRNGQHHLDLLAFLRVELPSFLSDYSYRFWSRFVSKYRCNFDKDQLSLFDWRRKVVKL